MQRLLLLPILTLCLLGNPQSTTPKDVFDALISALNAKDETKVRMFVKEHAAAGQVPEAQRVERLMGLAEMGAPFKVVGDIKVEGDVLRAVLQDKNGGKLGFVMQFTKDSKMLSLRVGDPNSMNAPPPKDYTGWTTLQSLADSVRKDTDSPAIGVALIQNGKWEEAYSGLRSVGGKDAVAKDDPWSIGSIGKSMCSTIIGRLIDMGKLKWDTTLGEALGDIPMKAAYRNVTLEQVMHHRGGVPQDLNFTGVRVMQITGGEKDPVKMRAKYAQDILNREPIGKPNEKFAYSNAGYALLGIIAERTMKKPYETLLHELVWGPLGMKHSYTGSDKVPTARANGHIRGQNGWQTYNMSGALEFLVAPAGGGIYCSVGDVARFGAAHLKGLRGEDGLLKHATIARLHTGIAEGPSGMLYACGWGIESIPGAETMHTHNGSNGTCRSQLAIFPKANLVVSSIVNCGGESEPSPPLQAVLAIAKKLAKG